VDQPDGVVGEQRVVAPGQLQVMRVMRKSSLTP
jgi:hypothetical protein